MEVFDFDYILSHPLKGRWALSVGVFDGVHYGHKKILESLEKVKREKKIKSAVISFKSNPKMKNARFIDTLRLREEYISSFDVNSFLLIDFSDKFSKISGCEFCSMLSSVMDIEALVVGSDFFLGSPSSQLDGYGVRKEFEKMAKPIDLIVVDFVKNREGEKISSTLLRKYISSGDLFSYNESSGQYYTLDSMSLPSEKSGSVIYVDISSCSQLLPPQGCYEVKVASDTCLAFLGASRLEIRKGSDDDVMDRIQFIRSIK